MGIISDTKYLLWQQGLAKRRVFRLFWKFWAIYSVAIILAVCTYLFTQGQIKILVVAFAAFVLARGIISPLIYFAYKKQRPYQKLNFIPLTSWFMSPQTKRYSSFPSDHAISFASISAVLVYYYPPLLVWLVILCLANGYSRVILGYHYILDIVAGWLLGILSAVIVIQWLAPMLFTPH